MKKKIVGIFVCMLLIASVFGSVIIAESDNYSKETVDFNDIVGPRNQCSQNSNELIASSAPADDLQDGNNNEFVPKVCTEQLEKIPEKKSENKEELLEFFESADRSIVLPDTGMGYEVKSPENPKNNRGTGWFYMDFNPSGDPQTLNGGRFEGETWTCDHDEWEPTGNNDPFDDTPQMSWTNQKGIYSAVRNDEDLNDGTTTEGAWCSCAKETGGAWPWDNEDSRGWATVKKSFNLEDYYDTSLPNFAFTDVDFCFDYKMYSNDFDDGNSHVYLNAYIKQGSNKWPLAYYWFSGAGDAPSETDGGYCLDFFDPSYTHQWHSMSNPNFVYNDYYRDKYTINTDGQGGQTVGHLYDLFNDNSNSYTLEFKIFVRCYGAGAGNTEKYQFWVDHVRFKCDYEYYYPDLTVEDIWIEPSDFDPGDTVTLKTTVKNIGDGDCDNPFKVQVKFDGTQYGYWTIQNLAAGQTVTPSTDITWPYSCAEHTIKITADFEDVIDESNENNNDLSENFAADCPTICFYTDPSNCGSITFGGATFYNGDCVLVPCSSYSIYANACSGFIFGHWSYTGGVSVSNPYSQSTTVTVTGSGSLKAHFKEEYTVTFYTDPTNGGTITFDGSTYSNDQTTQVTQGTYSLSAAPASGYIFDYWEESSNINIQDPNSQSTTVTVNGDGSITAHFTPDDNTVCFYTDPTNGGSISFDGTTYNNGDCTSVDDGTYSITANPASGYVFDYWSATGGVSISDPNSQTTTATVSANGDITAHFKEEYTVTFYTDPTNGGTITFDGSTYSNGQSTQVTSGIYVICANPASGFIFDHWSSTGGVSVSDPNSQSTTVTISGDGSLTAHFNGSNDPPYAPTDPIPEDGETDVSLNPTLSVYVYDPNGNDMDVEFWDYSAGTLICIDTDVASGERANCLWDGLEENTTYQWYTVADDGEYTNQSDVWEFTTGVNTPPNPPTIQGLTKGVVNIEYDFYIESVDPDGDDINYFVDWGDGSNTGWLGPYGSGTEITVTHSWSSTDDYEIKAKARDVNGGESPWSSHIISIIENEPPSAPEINGPTNGNAGTEYTYTFVTTDPNWDDVYYFIDWGDGQTEDWFGPFESGEVVTSSHVWNEKGDYKIRAQAKDIHDARSNWGEFEVTMPRNKAFNFNFNLLSWLFEQFPNAFPILRQLLGL